MPAFSSYPLAHGPLEDLCTDPFPTLVCGWDRRELTADAGGTHFGFVQDGPAALRCASGTFDLRAGMYFAVPGAVTITAGKGLLVTRSDHHGFFHVGGPVEGRGRLRYIDGCTDSLLVPPVVRGDPCLNLLHLPPRVRQTPHTHPSLRVGLVVRGAGACVTPDGRTPLTPGTVFIIHTNGLHCFHTDDAELLVVAYHPDSDFGPTDEIHPMRNRTIFGEVRS